MNKPDCHSDICPVCGGRKRSGKVLRSVDLGFGVVVVRGVAATVCGQCGGEWIEDATATRLENIANAARRDHRQLEVVAY